MKILITGANGFVGDALAKYLISKKHDVVACVRKRTHQSLACDYRFIEALDKNTDWSDILQGIDVIVHCAARVHVMDDKSVNPIEEFRKVNTAATLNLAEQALKAGVKRFIFLSSIKVNGEYTLPSKPFTEAVDRPPIDPYGLSKYEAEQNLLQLAKDTSLEVVIIRPTLVYGPNVKGNFQSLMRWTYRGVPLPLGGIKDNSRSLVSVDNLADLILTCIDHDKAKNEVFLVSDDNDMSTARLLQNIADGLGVKNRALRIPPILLKSAAFVIRKSDVAQRLCGSLQVDIHKAKSLLNWQPKYSMKDSMKKTAQSYINDLDS